MTTFAIPAVALSRAQPDHRASLVRIAEKAWQARKAKNGIHFPGPRSGALHNRVLFICAKKYERLRPLEAARTSAGEKNVGPQSHGHRRNPYHRQSLEAARAVPD